MIEPPTVIIVAGPNGAGKSTTARAVLPAGTPYINADEIAKTLSGPGRDIEAGRILLAEWRQCELDRGSFAIETTLSSRTLAPRIERMKSAGWRFMLNFLWLPSPELSVARVAGRVRLGGHAIPEPTIHRRYRAGIENLFYLYLPLADSWRVFDASAVAVDDPIAQGRGSVVTSVANPMLWERITPTTDAPRKLREQPAPYSDIDQVVQRMDALIADAMRAHKRAGVPAVGWRDGRLLVVPAEEIVVADVETVL